MVNTDEEAHIASAQSPSHEQWHCRFGHLNHTYIDQLIKDNLVEGTNCSTSKVNRECKACTQARCTGSLYPRKKKRKRVNPLNWCTSSGASLKCCQSLWSTSAGWKMKLVCEWEPSGLTVVENIHPSLLTRFVLTRELCISLLIHTHRSRIVSQKGWIVHWLNQQDPCSTMQRCH